MRGRPSSYSTWKARAICMRLMNGESLRSICNRKYYPPKATVFRWIHSIPGFRDQYTQAREVQQEYYLEEMFEIADDASNDWMERHDKEGNNIGWQLNGEHVNRSRLRIDTRKWVMERMSAKRYGNKQQIEHSGSVQELSDEQINKRLAELVNAKSDEAAED